MSVMDSFDIDRQLKHSDKRKAEARQRYNQEKKHRVNGENKTKTLRGKNQTLKSAGEYYKGRRDG